ncbi:hypothetical protein DENIS_3394 [Desulfonema ishimotonii]|uniref:DUF4843 domain-containing protein n=1 Tax=Desulfonema ishimotonii TaxID=45657 RepID=A0A401FZK4_9BACT|nr:hypothetical protein [Desulfonema ishimotonii]GBC62422.1 hypothetical protein DENIS_3394 [Desulfonema ishimotonii]
MNKNTSKKLRQIFLLLTVCTISPLFTGCATPELWRKSEETVAYSALKSEETRIYMDRTSPNNAGPGFGVTYQLKIPDKKLLDFPASATGTVFIRPDAKTRREPQYQALVALLDRRNGVHVESVSIYVKSRRGRPEAQLDVEFRLPEIDIDFEKHEYDWPFVVTRPSRKDFFGASEKTDYLLPMLVQKAWREKFNEKLDVRRMISPVAWLDENGNPARRYNSGGHPGLLLAVKPNRFDIKYIRIFGDVMGMQGLKDIPIDHRGDFARISVLADNVRVVPSVYNLPQWDVLNCPSSETLFDVEARDVTYINPLLARLFGTPFMMVLDLAIIMVAPLILIW